ncbi:LytR/AlgR family response regulator transcription factor [Azorhizobium doebereinerae]|uniref:LytR/AlgR family response regulator transcription factor n=1 Tax=Azorhizobium doebereinerae TaxID=281091 RepID=UPI00042A8C7E|nr:LytTR family DNA-binding domain-containing protein [Azorhizobium doebereinerae]
MLRVVIVDDEPLAVRAMRRLLAAHADVSVVGTADTLRAAAAVLAAERPDAVFLDIDLGTGTGFDLIARLDPAPKVVFVTAHAAYAVDAFAADAVDYLLKPVEPERLAEALARLNRAKAQAAPPAAPAAKGEILELRTPNRTVLAAPDDIAALCAEGDFTRVVLAEQPALLIWRTLSHFETVLPAPPFVRLSRSLILNRTRLRGFDTPSRNRSRVTLEGVAEPLVLGRVATTRLREALAKAGSAQPDQPER